MFLTGKTMFSRKAVCDADAAKGKFKILKTTILKMSLFNQFFIKLV